NSVGVGNLAVDVLVVVGCCGIAEEHFAQAAQFLIQPVGLLVCGLRQRDRKAVIETRTTTAGTVRGRKHLQAERLLRENRESAGGNLVARERIAGRRVNRHAGRSSGGNTSTASLRGEC